MNYNVVCGASLASPGSTNYDAVSITVPRGYTRYVTNLKHYIICGAQCMYIAFLGGRRQHPYILLLSVQSAQV